MLHEWTSSVEAKRLILFSSSIFREVSVNDLQMKELQDQLEAEQYFSVSYCCSVKFEPLCEKTGLWDFRPGPTQTELYKHRRWLEA